MNHISDSIFIKAKTGDSDAFEQLVNYYGALGYNIAFRMSGNAEDAADISQDAWVKVYKNLARCKSAAMFRPWFCTIVNNTCIDYLRRRKSNTVSLDEIFTNENGEYEVNIQDDQSPDPEETAIKNEQRNELFAAINRLSPAHKQMIIYRDLNGFSYEEIAAITKQKTGTVKSQIARAREALRKEL